MKKIPHLSDYDIARFWSFVDKDCDRTPAEENPELYSHVEGNCWEWTGFKDRDGYGRFYTNNTLDKGKRSFRAHRISYFLLNNDDPQNKLICHECDNPSCVRHLYKGTVKQNSEDMVSRGRWAGGSPSGEKSGSAKFTEKQIIEF